MCGHGVEPIQESCVNKRIISELPPFRVGRDVFKLSPIILSVSDSVLVEAGLPDFSGKLSAHLMGKAALDALGATLDGLVRGWGQ